MRALLGAGPVVPKKRKDIADNGRIQELETVVILTPYAAPTPGSTPDWIPPSAAAFTTMGTRDACHAPNNAKQPRMTSGRGTE